MDLHTTTTDGIPVVVTLEAGHILTVREARNDSTGWKAPLVMALPVGHVSPLILSDVFGADDVTRILAAL